MESKLTHFAPNLILEVLDRHIWTATMCASCVPWTCWEVVVPWFFPDVPRWTLTALWFLMVNCISFGKFPAHMTSLCWLCLHPRIMMVFPCTEVYGLFFSYIDYNMTRSFCWKWGQPLTTQVSQNFPGDAFHTIYIGVMRGFMLGFLMVP